MCSGCSIVSFLGAYRYQGTKYLIDFENPMCRIMRSSMYLRKPSIGLLETVRLLNVDFVTSGAGLASRFLHHQRGCGKVVNVGIAEKCVTGLMDAVLMIPFPSIMMFC